MTKRPLIWILLGWILGEIVVGWLGLFPASTSLDVVMEEKESVRATILAEVESVRESDYGYQVILKNTQVLVESELLSTHKLLWQDTDVDIAALQPGNQVYVEGTLSSFSLPSNPGQFNLRQYYRIQKIDYALTSLSWEVTDDHSFWWATISQQITEKMISGIQTVTASEEEAGLFLAILLGDRSELSDEWQTSFQLGGISHLLAISGLHLTLMGMGLWKLLRRLGMSLGISGGISSALLLGYVALIGGSASSWRAWIMFTAMLAARALGRTYDLLSALGLAGLLLLWDQPLYVWSASFQLSFGAMAGVGVVAPAAEAWRKKYASWGEELFGEEKKKKMAKKGGEWICRSLIFSGAISVTTLPLVAYHYFTLPLYGIFFNLLAVALMGYALASALLGSFFGIFCPILGIFITGTAHYVFQFLLFLCRLVQKIPGAVWISGRPSTGQIIIYYVLLVSLVVFLRRRTDPKKERKERREGKISSPSTPRPARLLFPLAIYVFAFVLVTRTPATNLKIAVLDVGQGDGIVLQLPGGGACLIDGGSSSLSNVGSKRILPYLKEEGIRELEMIFLTHGDSDHISGIVHILEEETIRVHGIALPVHNTDSSSWAEILAIAEQREIPIYFLQQGDVWERGEITLRVLHPDGEFSSSDENAYSLTLLLTCGEFQALFTGDLGQEEEEKILSLLPDVDVLKVGHHGSKNSSGENFLQKIQPELALISCGNNNLYGHPHADTMQRLFAVGAIPFSTADEGALLLTVRESKIEISLYLSGQNYYLPY